MRCVPSAGRALLALAARYDMPGVLAQGVQTDGSRVLEGAGATRAPVPCVVVASVADDRAGLVEGAITNGGRAMTEETELALRRQMVDLRMRMQNMEDKLAARNKMEVRIKALETRCDRLKAKLVLLDGDRHIPPPAQPIYVPYVPQREPQVS